MLSFDLIDLIITAIGLVVLGATGFFVVDFNLRLRERENDR